MRLLTCPLHDSQTVLCCQDNGSSKDNDIHQYEMSTRQHYWVAQHLNKYPDLLIYGIMIAINTEQNVLTLVLTLFFAFLA